MFLEIGTSNYGNAGTTTGKAWGGVVNAAWNWAKSSNVSSQVIIQGASDLELGWDTYTNTDAWVNGYESVTTQLYLDYGDAQGCPYGEYDNASCSGKGTWTQNRVRWIAYGQSNAISAPEIYFPGNAGSWAGISWYSKTYHGVELTYIAPWDEYDLDSGTDTPTQAWDDLWNYSNNLGVATTPPYSMKIHYE
jgi:hypothetical protein